MKKLNLILSAVLVASLFVALTGCVSRTKILDATAISMTRTSLAPGEKLVETGNVSGKFCADSFKQRGSFGLIDEAVKAAQLQSRTDWILNASFWREGSCIEVEGTGAKVASANIAPTAVRSNSHQVIKRKNGSR